MTAENFVRIKKMLKFLTELKSFRQRLLRWWMCLMGWSTQCKVTCSEQDSGGVTGSMDQGCHEHLRFLAV